MVVAAVVVVVVVVVVVIVVVVVVEVVEVVVVAVAVVKSLLFEALTVSDLQRSLEAQAFKICLLKLFAVRKT